MEKHSEIKFTKKQMDLNNRKMTNPPQVSL